MMRINVKRKRPNELFESWIEEWREQARIKKSNMEEHFSRALMSLKKYPLPLTSGAQCILLQNFGAKLCKMLDKKLEQHLGRDIIADRDKIDDNIFSNEKESGDKCSVPKTKPARAKKKPGKQSKLIDDNCLSSGPTGIAIDNFSMLPQTFDVVLLVDNNEKSTSCSLDKNSGKILYDVRHLKVGDFAWIARCRATKRELVLPYIVERKRMDDLGASIKDRRYHEQKFRLRKCGVDNVIYLIEGLSKSRQQYSMPIPVLFQAAVNSLVQSGFTVKFTKNQHDSLRYLTAFTTALTQLYKDKHLEKCSKENITPSSPSDEKVFLMEFNEFNQSSSKTKVYSVKEMFIRQLLQLKGLSLERALAIVNVYPTPFLLKEAFIEAGAEGDKLLANLTFGRVNRKLGPVLSKILYKLYTSDQLE
ncbi:crossover junction endonuclease MUS81 [Microplitis mediator]|uniref:crossover junction endonuclease MUS81 n=1 Tax=Microplitis mediator TaxID=375433 RepID=UPI00255565E0|nr:crossover junction endonuclease MUS81 [Microplitis mediator]